MNIESKKLLEDIKVFCFSDGYDIEKTLNFIECVCDIKNKIIIDIKNAVEAMTYTIEAMDTMHDIFNDHIQHMDNKFINNSYAYKDFIDRFNGAKSVGERNINILNEMIYSDNSFPYGKEFLLFVSNFRKKLKTYIKKFEQMEQ